MRQRLFILSLLPLLLLLSIVSTPSFGQDDSNPFGVDPDVPANVDPFAKPSETADDKLSQLKRKLLTLQLELKTVSQRNEALLRRANELEESETDLKLKAEQAEAIHGEMHQRLFDSLLFSDDSAVQELGLKHLVACFEKYRTAGRSISIYSTDVSRRLKLLTSSENKTVREMSSSCLYTMQPSDAMQLGIQFGARWKPLEYAKADVNSRRIYDQLARPCDMMYDEVPLAEILQELQQDHRTSFRLALNIDAKQTATYESVGRTFFNTLSDLLETKGLGFTIKDEEIVIMDEASPDLDSTLTYNVAGLNSLAQIETAEVIKLLEQDFGLEGVEFAKIGDHLFTAKTNLKIQRKIQNRIATLVPPPKWFSR